MRTNTMWHSHSASIRRCPHTSAAAEKFPATATRRKHSALRSLAANDANLLNLLQWAPQSVTPSVRPETCRSCHRLRPLCPIGLPIPNARSRSRITFSSSLARPGFGNLDLILNRIAQQKSISSLEREGQRKEKEGVAIAIGNRDRGIARCAADLMYVSL